MIRIRGNPAISITDHKELLNVGRYTHEELDKIVDEVNAGRGSFPSLNDRFAWIIDHIGTGGGVSVGSGALYEPHVIESNTALVTLKGSYVRGNGSLEVFRGGLRMTENVDYTEVTSKMVLFSQELYPKEIVVFRVRDRSIKSPLGSVTEYFLIENETTSELQLSSSFGELGEGLEVYVTGMLMTLGYDYTVMGNNIVKFNFLLPKGTLVDVRINSKDINDPKAQLTQVMLTDGSDYVLSNFTYMCGTNELELYVGGIRQRIGIDYEETGMDSFTLLKDYEKGLIMVACKENGGSHPDSHKHFSNILPTQDVSVATKFILPHIPKKNSAIVYVGGIRQCPSNYSIYRNVIEFAERPPSVVSVDYII